MRCLAVHGPHANEAMLCPPNLSLNIAGSEIISFPRKPPRAGLPLSAIGQTGKSEAIHSPAKFLKNNPMQSSPYDAGGTPFE
jgi:hypothetical protein